MQGPTLAAPANGAQGTIRPVTAVETTASGVQQAGAWRNSAEPALSAPANVRTAANLAPLDPFKDPFGDKVAQTTQPTRPPSRFQLTPPAGAPEMTPSRPGSGLPITPGLPDLQPTQPTLPGTTPPAGVSPDILPPPSTTPPTTPGAPGSLIPPPPSTTTPPSQLFPPSQTPTDPTLPNPTQPTLPSPTEPTLPGTTEPTRPTLPGTTEPSLPDTGLPPADLPDSGRPYDPRPLDPLPSGPEPIGSDPNCKRIYNRHDCCKEDADCDKEWAKVMTSPISLISLNITPSFAPDETDPARINQMRETALRNLKSRQWSDRSGNPLAEGRFQDFRNGKVIVEQYDGTTQALDARHLCADDRCYVNAWWGIPGECALPNDEFQMRDWTMLTYTWKASGVCHKPLYFEELALERYGHSHGPVVQPVLSGVHFFSHVAILPYKMGMNLPNECVYPLGLYRPGNCAPYLVPPLPISPRGAAFQAGAMAGGILLLP